MGSLNCRKWNTIPIINSSLKGFFTPQHLERAALIVWHLNAGGCCCLSKVTCCPGPYNKIGLISSVKLLQQPHHAVPRGFVFLGNHNTGIHWHNALFSLLWREMLVLLESHLCLGWRVSTSLHCSTGIDAKLWNKWYQEGTKENLLSPLEQ